MIVLQTTVVANEPVIPCLITRRSARHKRRANGGSLKTKRARVRRGKIADKPQIDARSELYLRGGVALAGLTIPWSNFFSLESVQISSPMSQGQVQVRAVEAEQVTVLATGPEKNIREDGRPRFHPPCDQQRASLANLLSGSEHRHTLYLAGFGELFAFSLGDLFGNKGPAVLRQVQGPNPALALERRDD